MAGAVAGGILGQLIPYKLEGIDFCMTALFVIILMGQLEKKGKQNTGCHRGDRVGNMPAGTG